MSKTLYLAGPMAGVPQGNFPLFTAVAAFLRSQGYAVVSPVELDSDAIRQEVMQITDDSYGKDGMAGGGETWGKVLSRDVEVLADGVLRLETDNEFMTRELLARARGYNPVIIRNDVRVPIDGIAFLPNWHKSRGARLEAFVGLLTGKEFYTVDGCNPQQWEIVSVIPEWVQYALASEWDGVRHFLPWGVLE